jgi:polyphosphate kinase
LIPALDPELSRLAFEERLIEYCEDPSVPLLERARLLGIAASRMDTFFMTRIGRLKHLVSIGKKAHGHSPEQMLERASAAAHKIMDRAYALLEKELVPALEKVGICIERWSDLTDEERRTIGQANAAKLTSCLRPLPIVRAAPFPHVRNLRPALVMVPVAKEEPLAVVELPPDLPRFITLPGDARRLVPLEEVIGGTLLELWPDRRFERVHVFRVTRSALMELDQDSDDVLEIVEQEVARRPFQEVVRAEFERSMPKPLAGRLLRDLKHEAEMQGSSLDERDIYPVERLIDLSTALTQVADIDLPDLKAEPLQPKDVQLGESIIDTIRKGDVLVRFPYDAYDATVGRVLDEASKRSDVESLKIALYRAGKKSAVVKALRAARARGVDVTAAVELKASFDERDNIELARSLEKDGVRVLLSPPDLKVHAKVALITLRDGTRITMIGTGNLNPKTASAYVDIWLLSADPARAKDLDAMFGVLMGRHEKPKLETLFIAPFNLRAGFMKLIERETANAVAGRASGIRAVMNGLSDPEIMDALRSASRAGVPIELMVRGVCSLLPGVPGESENIRVVSVLGQLLQHARIFEFQNSGAPEYFIGSADWRPRNMDHRIEVVTAVSGELHDRLRQALDETLSDRGGWEMRANGTYIRAESLSSQS